MKRRQRRSKTHRMIRYQFSALANDGQDTLLARADQVIE
jgi:hypothetical protein